MSSIWHSSEVAEIYNELSEPSAGAVDEEFIDKYISGLNCKVNVVSLGVGTGRELKWLCDIDSVQKIIGVDYSEEMLNLCERNASKYEKQIELVRDDLLSLEKLRLGLQEDEKPVIYLILLNTLGNFSERRREEILRRVRGLMGDEDKLIVAVYKLPEEIENDNHLPFPEDFVKNFGRCKTTVASEYSLNEILWAYAIKEHGKIPKFWYDEEKEDVVAYVGDEKVFFSHRFSKEEIKELFKDTGFDIDEVFEGKFMWIVVAGPSKDQIR